MPSAAALIHKQWAVVVVMVWDIPRETVWEAEGQSRRHWKGAVFSFRNRGVFTNLRLTPPAESNNLPPFWLALMSLPVGEDMACILSSKRQEEVRLIGCFRRLTPLVFLGEGLNVAGAASSPIVAMGWDNPD